MKLTREFYISRHELIKKTNFGQAYWREDFKAGMLFKGSKKAKPEWRYKFKSKEEFIEKAEKSLELLEKFNKERKEYRKKRAIEKKKRLEEVEVGEIYYSSWGYEQTNINFYQVVERKGLSFTIREIAQEQVEGSMVSHGMACDVKPVKNSFLKKSEPITRRSFNIDDVRYISKTTEDKAHYKSWYY